MLIAAVFAVTVVASAQAAPPATPQKLFESGKILSLIHI